MHVSIQSLLDHADEHQYAVGAFNVYNLEGVLAVVQAAESCESPAIIQIHPKALKFSSLGLVDLALSCADDAAVPIAVHLDHCQDLQLVESVVQRGVQSVMADGAHLSYEENLRFTQQVVAVATRYNASVEGEIGLITGTEDGITIAEQAERMTDPAEAHAFVQSSDIGSLAVCIGNVHGHYKVEPQLDFERLSQIRDIVRIPLVLHGTSGLNDQDIRRCIEYGVRKFNINTDVRAAYIVSIRTSVSDQNMDLLPLMRRAVDSMSKVIRQKIQLFGSAGYARH